MQKPQLVSFVVGIAIVVITGVPTVAVAQPFAATHAAAGSKSVSARTLLNHLTVTKETHASSYARSKFKAWIDADHDGEDTRAEVLQAESLKKVTVSKNGTVKAGRWISRYDGITVTVASKLDIDHLVPLEEAWVSGAAGWSALKREAYANDLGYAADLIAVSAHANRSKGDREPNAYLPAETSYRCTYVKNFIAVKTRWHLSVNAAEKTALGRDLATYCTKLAVKKPATPSIPVLTGRAAAPTLGSLPSETAKPTPTPTPSDDPPVLPVVSTSPTPAPTPTVTSAPTVYYANCDAVRAAGKAPLYRGQPGYRSGLDRDGDGVACEAT